MWGGMEPPARQNPFGDEEVEEGADPGGHRVIEVVGNPRPESSRIDESERQGAGGQGIAANHAAEMFRGISLKEGPQSGARDMEHQDRGEEESRLPGQAAMCVKGQPEAGGQHESKGGDGVEYSRDSMGVPTHTGRREE